VSIDDETDQWVARVLATIRAEMARRGLTSVTLAERVSGISDDGMASYTLRERLRGKSDLRLRELHRIAAALDVPITTLLGDDPPPGR
jgi:transcriptional regulator with XRE-family HTH domain